MPRLSLRTVFQLKEQMRILLPLVKVSNMWILNNSIRTTHEHIVEALGSECKYLVNEEKGINDKSHGWHVFDQEVKQNVNAFFNKHKNNDTIKNFSEELGQVPTIYQII